MKLKHLYIALGLSALLTGCKDEEPMVMPTEDIVKIPVSFSIRLDSEDATRGDARIGIWEDGEDPSNDREGTTFENTINSLTPVLYLADYRGIIDEKNPIAVLDGATTLTSTNISPSVNAGGEMIDGQFDVSGKMICSGLTSSQLIDCQDRLRLAVFINCAEDDVMLPLDIRRPAQATFNHHGKPDDCKDSGSKHFHGIPMYGVSGVSFFKEKDSDGNDVYKVYDPNSTEEQKQTLSIPILRSMAKVRVKLNADKEGKIDGKEVKLSSLFISRHAVKGYVVPKDWDKVTDVTLLNFNGKGCNPLFSDNYKGGDYNHACYVEPQPQDDKDINEIHQGDEEYYKNSEDLLRFYIPDTYNCTNDADDTSPEIYMELTYTVDGNEYTHPLFFRPQNQWPRAEGKDEYSDDSTIPNLPNLTKFGAPWDIIRNHIYEFVIEGVEETTGNLQVNVKVNEWKDHDNIKLKY